MPTKGADTTTNSLGSFVIIALGVGLTKTSKVLCWELALLSLKFYQLTNFAVKRTLHLLPLLSRTCYVDCDRSLGLVDTGAATSSSLLKDSLFNARKASIYRGFAANIIQYAQERQNIRTDPISPQLSRGESDVEETT